MSFMSEHDPIVSACDNCGRSIHKLDTYFLCHITRFTYLTLCRYCVNVVNGSINDGSDWSGFETQGR